MPEELSRPILAYIQAKQDHDTDALISTLRNDAVVIDEGHEYKGLKAIRMWCEKMSSTFRTTYEVGDVEEKAGETIVEVEVSGNFPGSPTLLPLHFTVAEGKISRVLIES
jgi:ketosteroid isomerase-like protein